MSKNRLFSMAAVAAMSSALLLTGCDDGKSKKDYEALPKPTGSSTHDHDHDGDGHADHDHDDHDHEHDDHDHKDDKK